MRIHVIKSVVLTALSLATLCLSIPVLTGCGDKPKAEELKDAKLENKIPDDIEKEIKEIEEKKK